MGLRQRYGTTFAQVSSGQTRTVYADRNKYIIALNQTRYMTAQVKKDSRGIPHVMIEVDEARNVDDKSRQPAGKDPLEIANSYMLMAAEVLTAIAIPPLGVVELILSASLNFMENMIDKGNAAHDQNLLNGVSVPQLMASINASWGGFDHLSATDASIDGGLSLIGNLDFSA